MAKGVVIGGLNGLGGGSNIKSIQRGETSFVGGTSSLNVPISSVDINKSIVIAVPKMTSASQTPSTFFARTKIASATSLQINLGANSYGNPIRWQVIEFDKVKSLQKGDVNISSSSVINVTAVNPNKSILFFNYYHNYTANDKMGPSSGNGFLNTGGLSITLEIFEATGFFHWQLLEFE